MKTEDKYYELDLRKLRESLEDDLEESSEEMDEDEMLSELKLVLDLGDIDKDQIPEELQGMLEDDEDVEGNLDDDDMPEDDSEMDDMSDEDTEDMDDEEMSDEDSFEEKALTEIMGHLGLNEADDDDEVEVSEKQITEAFKKFKKSLKEGKFDSSFGGSGKANAGVDGAFGGKGSAKAGVDGAFGGGRPGKDVFQNPPELNKLHEKLDDERRKNRALAEDLDKYRKAVKALREQLEDLNLFNAKLLYVNKLMQNKNLNESEKKSVIKALDAATSLNEAKQLFTSLTETFARNIDRKLNESVRSGSPSKTTSRSSVLKENSQVDDSFDKWQKLAGLK
jgi:hypothetical protein